MSATPYYRVDAEHSGELGREIRIFGPPGTGKTTFLSGSVKNTALMRGGDNVLVASFTVTAAAELKGRGLPLPKSQIGTLHSLAYRALDRPPVADEQMDDWNTHHPAYARTASRKANADDGAPLEAGMSGATEGDALASALDALRARRVPREEWPRDVASFAEKWEDWKRSNGLIDFTDMIEFAVQDVSTAPGAPDVGFFDEVQDFTPLELSLIRSWGQHMERVILAGDDDQCHPPGELVRTVNRGDVPIEDLRAGDRLVSFDQRGGSELRRRGYEWRRGHRPYRGEVVTIETPAGRTTVTMNHRLVARWMDTDRTAVYLMRRGDTWRVGTTRLLREKAGQVFGPGQRARQEQADALWILSTHASNAAAQLAEDRVSTRYGISTMVFRAPTSGTALLHAQGQLDAHHAATAATARPLDALRDHGRLVEYPLWEPDRKQRGRTTLMDIRAANFMPEVMAVPVDTGGSRVEWHRATATRAPYDGIVYSLEVEPYPYYVAGGIVVHNCIYGFKGASPDAFLKPDIPDGDKIVLSQSWRIPAAVHRAAEHWIKQVSHREEKLYSPREEEGAVRQIGASYQHALQLTDQIEAALAQTVTEPDGTVRPATAMLLAPCGYMLDPVKHELRKRGVPFHNPYRTSRGDWNPMRSATKEGQVTSRERLLAYLMLDERDDVGMGEDARPWTGEDVRRWAAVVKKRGVFRTGAAATLEQLPGRELEYEEVAALFATEVELEQAVTPDLGWFERNLLAGSRAGMAFPLQVAKVRGARALTEEPRVVLGTIHSVKGGQADCSPPDEPVLTTNRGWVPIAELNPETDRLVSFNSDHHKIHRGGPRRPDGYAFTRGSREYAGPMLTLTTPASRTRVTPNHHLTVRWNAAAMKAHAVYLMRRGDRWRIGMTAMRHGDNGQSGPLMRGRREGADAVWLLSLHHSRAEAALTEQHLAWTFGVPDATWRAGRGQSQDQLDRFWSLLADQSEQGAKELLALHGQDAAWPMWDLTADVTRRQAGRRNRWQIRAANLMPRWMQLPTDPGHGQEPVWHDVEVTSAPYDGRVYSLDVERWHHYVSGGAVVHNCVFLVPDLSSRGSNEWRQRGAPQDGVRRQMYVGMTRAKRELVLCAAATGLHVPPEKMIEGAKRVDR